MTALSVARLLLAPALLALAAWFALLRHRRPDLITRWLAAKVVALLAAVALAAVATGAGPPWMALGGVALADALAWFLAARLWLERRPQPLSPEGAAREARRLADEAIGLTAVAERQKAGGNGGAR